MQSYKLLGKKRMMNDDCDDDVMMECLCYNFHFDAIIMYELCVCMHVIVKTQPLFQRRLYVCMYVMCIVSLSLSSSFNLTCTTRVRLVALYIPTLISLPHHQTPLYLPNLPNLSTYQALTQHKKYT